jgi:hypothetical protein
VPPTGALVLTNDPEEAEPALPVPPTGALVLTNGESAVAAVEPPVELVLSTGAVLTTVPEEGEPAAPAIIELPATCGACAVLPWGEAVATPWHVPAKADADGANIPAAASPRMDMPIAATTAATTRFIVVVISKSPHWLVVCVVCFDGHRAADWNRNA